MRTAVLAVVLMLFGCASTPDPPTDEASCYAPRVFQVVNHGWHTGLVIKSRDLLKTLPALTDEFADAQFVEIGWGDAGFYRAPEATLGLALRALFHSQGAVLHVVKVPGDPQRYFAGSEMVEVRVTEGGYRHLLAFVAGTFTRSPEKAVEALGPGLYGNSQFYRAGGTYSVSHTSNTWIAEAAAASGLPISSASVLTAGGVMSQLRQATSTTASCVYGALGVSSLRCFTMPTYSPTMRGTGGQLHNTCCEPSPCFSSTEFMIAICGASNPSSQTRSNAPSQCADD